ncbi:hypothetical protein EES39_28040 [Streptomyces sp. ADI92-24]|nr:hypothetical protein EES39_28040 [Streptomyces sp. ADI92-24]
MSGRGPSGSATSVVVFGGTRAETVSTPSVTAHSTLALPYG